MKLTHKEHALWVSLVALICVAGRFQMLDDLPEPDQVEEARAAMVVQAAERACGGDIVRTPSGARCASDGTSVRLAATIPVVARTQVSQ